MRKVGNKQNLIESPLNFIFGQGEAAVRILRILSKFQGTFLGIPEITAKTGLSNTGARRTLDSLEKGGLLSSPHSTKKSYALRKENPLVSIVIELFQKEEVFYSSLKDQILAAFGGHGHTSSLWLASDYFEPGKPLKVHFIAPSERISEIVQTASELLSALESRLDVSIDIVPHEQDSLIDSPKDFFLLSGLPPEVFSSNRKPIKKAPRTNDEQRQAALAKAEKIAEIIEKDPSLIMDARNKLSLQIEKASPSTRQQLLKWQRLLTGGSVRRIKQTLCDTSPEAERMRQSNPFSYLVINE